MSTIHIFIRNRRVQYDTDCPQCLPSLSKRTFVLYMRSMNQNLVFQVTAFETLFFYIFFLVFLKKGD